MPTSRWLPIALLLFAVSWPADARSNPVDLSMLAVLPPAELEPLAPAHFQTLVSRIALAGAETDVDQAKTAAKEADRVVGAKEANRKAAKAELKAAEKNEDEARRRNARTLVDSAESDLAIAKAFFSWKNAELKHYQALVKQAEALVRLRDAELETAKAELLARTPATSGYPVEKYRSEEGKARKKLGDAEAKAAKENDRARQRRGAWESIARPGE